MHHASRFYLKVHHTSVTCDVTRLMHGQTPDPEVEANLQTHLRRCVLTQQRKAFMIWQQEQIAGSSLMMQGAHVIIVFLASLSFLVCLCHLILSPVSRSIALHSFPSPSFPIRPLFLPPQPIFRVIDGPKSYFVGPDDPDP